METRGERSNTFPHQQEHSAMQAAENAQIPLWENPGFPCDAERFSEAELNEALESLGKAQKAAAEAMFRVLSIAPVRQLDDEIAALRRAQAERYEAYTRPDILGAIGSSSPFLPVLPEDQHESIVQAIENDWRRVGCDLWISLLDHVRKGKSRARDAP